MPSRAAERFVSTTRFEGQTAQELASSWRLPRVQIEDAVPSTQDVAHALAGEGELAGTLVIANAQTAGRGRSGKTWQSGNRDVCLSMVLRPRDGETLGALPLRVGLLLAEALEPIARESLTLKWPNDVYTARGKLAGILVEARWRGIALDWVTVGVGINVGPGLRHAAAAHLGGDVDRRAVAAVAVHAVRTAGDLAGPLTEVELQAFRSRDCALHRRCVAPRVGIVAGVEASGALLVDTADGRVAVPSGSLILEEVA